MMVIVVALYIVLNKLPIFDTNPILEILHRKLHFKLQKNTTLS